jgi:hypothetical protein
MITLQVSPVAYNVDLVPNVRTDLAINVANAGTENASFRVYAEMYPLAETDVQTQWVLSPYMALHKWISFDQAEYHDVAPDQSVQVTAHITVPIGTVDGQQQAVVFIESLPSGNSTASIEAVGRVGSIVTANIAPSPTPEMPMWPAVTALVVMVITVVAIIARNTFSQSR